MKLQPQSQKFILMATPNSNESNWIPWELGLGDGFINYPNVAIFPITNDSNYWQESEYYSIYGYLKKVIVKINLDLIGSYFSLAVKQFG